MSCKNINSNSLTAEELDTLFSSHMRVDRLDKPKAGEVFLFHSDKKDDWRADGYR